jgi:hypothetical protein
MSADSKPLQSGRQARSWMMLLVGGVFALLGAIALWTAADTALHAWPATAKVIATEGGIGGKHTVHAQVDVSMPGKKTFRTEVEDTLGLGSWTEGGTVNLVCTTPAMRSPHCDLDSALDRWLFPSIFFALGAGAVWLALRRAKP